MWCAAKGYCAECIASCIVVQREFPLYLCAFTVEFAIKFVLKGFDLASRIRSDSPAGLKNGASI